MFDKFCMYRPFLYFLLNLRHFRIVLPDFLCISKSKINTGFLVEVNQALYSLVVFDDVQCALCMTSLLKRMKEVHGCKEK